MREDPPDWQTGAGAQRGSQPVLNAPPVVLWLLAAITGAHLLRVLLPYEVQVQLIYSFAFIPVRFAAPAEAIFDVPFILGSAGRWLTVVSHAFLHADLFHLIFNSVWLLAFGTPVARRIGNQRFIALFLVCAVFGALAHWVGNPSGLVPVIGASGAIAGLMGAAARFVFSAPMFTQGAFGLDGRYDHVPLSPLTDRRVFGFVAVWIGINLVFGLTGLGLSGETQMIAWEAHLGGFFAGLLLMPLFDRGTGPTVH